PGKKSGFEHICSVQQRELIHLRPRKGRLRLFRFQEVIAGLTLENAAARRPLLPFGRRLVPEELHGQIRRRATAGTSISKGCARRITIAHKGLHEKRKALIQRAKSCSSRGGLGFTWQNTLPFVWRMGE